MRFAVTFTDFAAVRAPIGPSITGHARNRVLCGLIWTMLLGVVTAGETPPRPTSFHLQPQTEIIFADQTEARTILMRRDQFVQHMTNLDRQLRMGSTEPVSEDEFLRQLGKQAQAWSADEILRIRQALDPLANRFATFRSLWPRQIQLVKTTHQVENGAPHCRQSAIVLPQTILSQDAKRLQEVLVHELFHVCSSHTPKLRKELYRLIGFFECPPIVLPNALQERKITNPDAPLVNCVTTIRHEGQELHLAPLLLSRHAAHELPADTSIFRELTFRLIRVMPQNSSWRVAEQNGTSTLFEHRQLPEWWAQIGRNTNYVIHPEEILADNFAIMVLEKGDVPDPWITERMEALLQPTEKLPESTSAE